MEATRVRARLAPTGEWLVATLFLLCHELVYRR